MQTTKQLMTPALEKRFAEVGSQRSVEDPVVITMFVNTIGKGIWLATEYDPKRRMFYGYISKLGGSYDDWGEFFLVELASFKGTFGMGIERNEDFEERSAEELIFIYCTR